MNRKNIITTLENLKLAIGIWSDKRIKNNIDRIIKEYKEAKKSNRKKGKLITCVRNGQVILDTELDGSLSIYEVKK